MTKRDLIIDYLLCSLFKVSGPLVRCMPKAFSLSLGRLLGGLVYYFETEHRAVAYSNIKTAFGDRFTPPELKKLTHEFYRTFGESIMEIFLIPQVGKNYLKEYIEIVGQENVQVAFDKGKGIILLAVHEGSWELSNIICAHLAFPFNFFVRDQKYPRLDHILNLYRTQQGCRVIQRQNQLRQLIGALKKNEAIGITADQGGKTGALVNFFGRSASMSTGGVKLALRSGAVIIPCFYVRLKGPYIRVIFAPPFEVKKSGERDKDVHDNLEQLVSVFEKYIAMYPKEYLWFYKIWKYGLDKNILILSDAKAGHLRQSQAVSEHLHGCLKERNNTATVDTIEVRFKNRFARRALALSICLSGKYRCQGCLKCLKVALDKQAYSALIGKKYDFIISCGTSLAPVNFLLARENLAKSVVIMRPSILSTKRFDLVIMPRHDRPPRRKNVVTTDGALTLINEAYLKEQSAGLLKTAAIRPPQSFGGRPPELCGGRHPLSAFCIGLLIGGDTRQFKLKKDTVLKIIKQVKAVSGELDADILISTSRRTPAEVEDLIESEFKDHSRCKLLVIANKKNIPEAVGGILDLSSIVITSPESISMISEAASSKKYVLVFNAAGLRNKHRRALDYFKENKYISLVEAEGLGGALRDIWRNKPQVYNLGDASLVREALKLLI
ncbi:MAG: ELM1/GtrOC1 family putative glycosyltransferase [Candidatus Omnitrophota bacterium]